MAKKPKFTDAEKKVAQDTLLSLFDKFRKTEDPKYSEQMQEIVDKMDMPFCISYQDKGAEHETPHLWLPPRLKKLPRRVLLNRLNLK